MQLLAFAACILQPNSANSVAHEHFSKVDYCDLIRHASDYDGKAVAVKATYRYGFEWQELYCVGCAAPSKIWLDFSPDSAFESRRPFARAPRHQGTLNGTFYGSFESTGGPFGDGGYKYRLRLQKVANVRVVSKSGGVASSLPASERAKVCGGGNQPPPPGHDDVRPHSGGSTLPSAPVSGRRERVTLESCSGANKLAKWQLLTTKKAHERVAMRRRFFHAFSSWWAGAFHRRSDFA